MNYHLTIEPYLNPYWLKEDIDYLGRIIKFQVSPQKLKEKFSIPSFPEKEIKKTSLDDFMICHT
jgi:hypothetical protein